MVRRPLGNHHDGPDTLLVTSDATQTESVTYETENDRKDQNHRKDLNDPDKLNELNELISGARVVLWDFDGPICRLFAGHSAERVATDLVEWLEGRGLHGLLTEPERESLDPHAVLRAVDRRHPGSDLVAELEARLTQEEMLAASSARPTAYADPLIRTWTAVGSRPAIATNNSPHVARKYLADRGLLGCFAPHIYGRTQQLSRLKPDPHCINRALNAMGAAPDSALMIGDTPSDFHAAEAAGVPFLGYARNEEKEKILQAAGATVILSSLEPVLTLLRTAPQA
ncbi:HAD family hydrolase [Streptomyces sp. NPDC005774]|uniref:HAD family hydrolase n=1 Tax=Streptomyces sp. NPDC005774 TaxID=3364728 RepID=UPI0036C0500E